MFSVINAMKVAL